MTRDRRLEWIGFLLALLALLVVLAGCTTAPSADPGPNFWRAPCAARDR